MTEAEINRQSPAAFAPRRSKTAVWSLVLGCLFFIPPLGIVALVLGIVAVVQIAGSRGALTGKPQAVAGIALGGLSVVLLCFFAPFAALFLPALSKAREQARATSCKSNLKQVGLAIAMYQVDYGDQMPPDLQTVVDNGYLKGAGGVLTCPSSRSQGVDTMKVDQTADYVYAYVPKIKDLAAIVPIAWDGNDVHMRNCVNVLFSDFSVRFTPVAELSRQVGLYGDRYSGTPAIPGIRLVPPVNVALDGSSVFYQCRSTGERFVISGKQLEDFDTYTKYMVPFGTPVECLVCGGKDAYLSYHCPECGKWYEYESGQSQSGTVRCPEGHAVLEPEEAV